jgi:TRAP-type C4-dicarboxylate transport system permease small subunit
MNNVVVRAFDKFIAACNMIGSLYIFFLMFVIVRDVGGRIFFKNALVGTPEIVANSLVAILFLQITYVLHEGRHVRATILYDKFPYKVRCILDIVMCIIGIGLFILIIYSGWNLFLKAVEIGEYEGEGGFHFYTAPVRFMILFGSALMSIQFLILTVRYIKKLLYKNDSDKGGAA